MIDTVNIQPSENEISEKPYVFDEPRSVPPRPAYFMILLTQLAVAAALFAGLYLARRVSPQLYDSIAEFINVRVRVW